MDIVFVVAVARNRVIGANGAMPWRLKSDMQRFRALTLGKPVVMGRKTFASLRKPLVGRTNIVMTRDAGFAMDGALAVGSLEAAQVYAQWLPLATRLEITEVHDAPAGDTFLPAPDATVWIETARVAHPRGPDDSADVSHVTYRLRAAV
jgi:dihydrofolate reductase